ncbi:MAG: ATP-dependent DNA ligase [Candidatus Thorarchaeota archaeon]
MTEFSKLAYTLDAIAATTKRNEKIEIISSFLRELNLNEVHFGTLALAGRVFSESDQRTTNTSWAGIISALKRVIAFEDHEIGEFYKGDAGEAIESMMLSGRFSRQQSLLTEPLTLNSVSSAIKQIAEAEGKGSKTTRESILVRILQDATPKELRYVVALILGDTRTGVSDAIVADGVSKAYAIDAELIRRAWSVTGDLGKVAEIAASQGEPGIKDIRMELYTPVKPMLATPSDSIEDVVGDFKEIYLCEFKYDGARVQIHKGTDGVKIFSRRLQDVTQSMPDIVKLIEEKIAANTAILDGEIVAVDSQGSPYPFQIVMKRFGRSTDVDAAVEEIQLRLHLFDVLLLDNSSLLDQPLEHRRRILEGISPSELIAEQFDFRDLRKIEEAFHDSKRLGHEGVMLKKANSPYYPGKRGRYWFKVKHTMETLDLVVIAAEWGHGRRRNWLSDYHLAAWDEDRGEFVMIGKTYKGLTDKELSEMTHRLQEISTQSSRGIVFVKPEIVVEVVAAELQKSSTYDAGIALRFARISRIREDLGPSDATTLKRLNEIYESQFEYKAR